MSDSINVTIETNPTEVNLTIEETAPIQVNFRDIAVPDASVIANRIAAENAADAAATSQSSAASSAANAASSASSANDSASSASTSAGNAATSESNAATSASNASDSADTATTQASNASDSASAAATSASSAATSAANAGTSETNAANSATAAANSAASIGLTTKGDLLTRNASANTRLAVGADGKFLKADSAASEGVSWDDVAVADGSVTAAKLASNAVETAKILDGAITNDKVGASAAIAISKTNYAVAFLKDVKASATGGGTFTSGAWQTRTLNTEEDTDGIVSLSSNQFTLQAGTYDIEAYAPGYRVDNHKAKIRNITDSTDAIIGAWAYNGAAVGYAATMAMVLGTITIASAKTFELQHRCQTTHTTHGFGVGFDFGVSEIYAQVKITRIK